MHKHALLCEFLQRRLIRPLLAQLRQGVTPEKLALSSEPGHGHRAGSGAALAAFFLRLDMPAIQLVNYLLTPVQIMLTLVLYRLFEPALRPLALTPVR